MNKFVFFSNVCLFLSAICEARKISERRELVAYDNDDRMEESAATSAMKALGQAGVMLATKSDLTRDGDYFTFNPAGHSQVRRARSSLYK